MSAYRGVHLPLCGQTDTWENNLSATVVADGNKSKFCMFLVEMVVQLGSGIKQK